MDIRFRGLLLTQEKFAVSIKAARAELSFSVSRHWVRLVCVLKAVTCHLVPSE